MQREAFDPLLLGQRLVALLETGLRTATYKLATLMALLEHCIENLPQRADDTLRVPLQELAHRVLEIYWRQVRPFDGHELRQSTHSHARILSPPTSYVRPQAEPPVRSTSRDGARLRHTRRRSTRSRCAWRSSPARPCVAVNPACERRRDRTQSRRRPRARSTGGAPQACAGDHVGRGCPPDEQVPRRRSSRRGGASVRARTNRVGSSTFAVQRGVRPALLLLRDASAGEQSDRPRASVVAAARGIYRGQPAGVPTWSGYKTIERLDFSFPPSWISSKDGEY